jgi:hypothetical protein
MLDRSVSGARERLPEILPDGAIHLASMTPWGDEISPDKGRPLSATPHIFRPVQIQLNDRLERLSEQVSDNYHQPTFLTLWTLQTPTSDSTSARSAKFRF